jgi:hypothetical protein
MIYASLANMQPQANEASSAVATGTCIEEISRAPRVLEAGLRVSRNRNALLILLPYYTL